MENVEIAKMIMIGLGITYLGVFPALFILALLMRPITGNWDAFTKAFRLFDLLNTILLIPLVLLFGLSLVENALANNEN